MSDESSEKVSELDVLVHNSQIFSMPIKQLIWIANRIILFTAKEIAYNSGAIKLQ